MVTIGEFIPKELKEKKQWVCWQTEIRDDKPTKVLKNPSTGGNAKANDPKTWGTFELAQQASSRYGFSGIGFVFSKDDEYCGIDLDKCRKPETSEIDPWAKEIIEKLNSYTEVSPSGTGVHIIVKAMLPPDGRRKGKIEMYDDGRYFTVTGDHLSQSPLVIEQRQKELEEIHTELFKTPEPSNLIALPVNLSDSELIEKAIRAENGRKFELLWRGDWQGAGYSSQSEADLAFCSMLAFWCGRDANMIDSLFRQSGLSRNKWDEKHFSDGRTYGQQVINKAVSTTREIYEPGIPKHKIEASSPSQHISNCDVMTLSLRRLCDVSEPEPMTFIVEDFAPKDYPTMFYGDGGQGKSYIILALATCVVTGKPFLGKSVYKGNVLYVDFELDENEQARRAYKVARGLDLEKPPEGLYYFSPTTQEQLVSNLNVIIDALVGLIEQHNIVLTIVDSFGAAVSGDPESAKDVTALFQKLRKLGTIIILDHQGKITSGEKYKDKTAFGSVYKSNLSRNIWQLQRLPETDSPDNEIKLALHHKKSNFGPMRETVCLKAAFGEAFTVEQVEPDIDFGEVLSTKDRVLVAFIEFGRATAEEVAEETGIALGTVKNKITQLKREGKLQETGEKRGQAHIYRSVITSQPYISSDSDDASPTVNLLASLLSSDGDGDKSNLATAGNQATMEDYYELDL